MTPRALAIALLATLAACRDATGPVTLTFWAMGREGELVTRLIGDFEREHPDIRVEVQALPWMSAHEKLLTAYVGEATPDVAQLGNTWLPELATLGALAALDGDVAASQVVRPPDYFAGIWRTNQLDGALYGVPWYVDTRVLFYRRDRFAAAGFATPPASWPAWMTALREVQSEIAPGQFAILLAVDEFDQLLALALQQDDPLLADGGRWGNFHSAGFRRALGFYLGMFAERLAPVVTLIQVPDPWSELARGYISSMIHGPWSIAEFRERLPAEQQALWATAPLPGPDGPGASTAGGSSLVVFRRSAHRRQAWQLIEYLSRPEIQARFYALSGNLPPRRTTWRDPRLVDPAVAAFRDQLERVRPAPPVPEWERIVTEMRVVSERAVRRVVALPAPPTAAQIAAIVDEAVADLDARTDQMLDKRRWILARRSAR